MKLKEKDNHIQEQNKIILEKDKIIKLKDCKLNNYKNELKEIIKNKNSIKIKYKNDNNENEIRIFGDKFISNNKNICKILYNNKIYDLISKFNVKNINKSIRN